ncbi:MAG: hypothetical protein Q4C98_06770 [Capnocytophaga sp.]|nr:hypothetical protein [Capnocytophaga sp.]
MKYRFFIILGLFLGGFSANSQEIKVETDTKTIKIGEQIKYKISVETTADDAVFFPDGQTFMPLEMVRSSAVDTMRKQEKYRFVKEYFLTQFDSGSYTIPRQKIVVNAKDFYTDSLLVQVHSVAVDTLKQPLFDIKPIMEVNPTSKSTYMWWIFGIIAFLVIGFLVYYFIFRKKKLSEEELRRKLPPFERAIQDLKNLQNSKYLIESKHKAYYSKLTDIVREYLEDEVHILAKESTTDELVSKIKMLQESGSLNLSEETIKNLKNVLQTADLVKFAKNTPTDSTAEYDRATIEDVVVKTKNAIPEATDQSLISLKEAIQKSKQRTRKKALITTLSVVGIFALLIIFTGGYVMSYSLSHLYGNESIKELSNSKWVTSDYGYPITQLSTPKVLKRKQIVNIKGFENIIDKEYVFDYGNINSPLYIMTSVITFKKSDDNQPLSLDPAQVNEIVLAQLDATGAQNVTTLDEEYTAPNGAEGMKVSGKMVLTDASTQKTFNASYELYSFTQNGALQQLLITHIDALLAEEMAQKIVNSINFKMD